MKVLLFNNYFRMKTNIENWPLTCNFDDLDRTEQKQVRDTMGEETYRAQRELHRLFARTTAPLEPLNATKEKLDAAFKARYNTLVAGSKQNHSPAAEAPLSAINCDSGGTASTQPFTKATSENRPVVRRRIYFRKAMQVAAALVLIMAGYSLSFVNTPVPEAIPTDREVIRYVDRPVLEVHYRTVYVDRPVKVYEQLPAAETLPVEVTDNLALNENQGVSLAGDSVMQALMVTLN
jgi:hypothetical protein